MIRLLGTSHIAQESVAQLQQQFLEWKPDFVGVELDRQRLHALLSKQSSSLRVRDVFKIGAMGFLFAYIGAKVQQYLAKQYGANIGQEMLAAVQLAREHNIKLILLDQDIQTTLRRISKAFSFREKFRLVRDILRSLVMPRQELEKWGFRDLSKVPSRDVVDSLTHLLRQRYPSLYQVLIEERNQVMVKRLIHIQRLHPEARILAVIGAGHVSGIEALLDEQRDTFAE